MGFAECVRHPAVQLCIRVTRWLPVVFIVVVICWSYYAYVVELCFFTVDSIVEKVLYLIPYHVILFLFLWSYYQTTFADVLEPPKHFAIPGFAVEQMKQSSPSNQRQILEGVAKDLPVYTRSFDGSVRFCEKCNVVKPDRSHHCAICGVCVLKMDHHCPWVNTCVHYNNYKFFVLFLGYALLFCLFVFLTDLQYFIKFWTDNYASKGGGKFHIMFLFFVSGMFAISVSSLFFYHLWLTAKNRSTLESFRPPVFVSGPDKNGFNLGCGKNFQQIFGKFSVRAFVPLFTSPGDGSTYPVRSGLLLTQNGPPNSHSPPPHVEEEGRASSRTRPDDLSRTQFHILNDGGYELNGVISASGSKDNESSWMNDFPNAGDGTRFPSKTIRFDEEELLRHGSRWTDETDESSASEYENGRANGFRLSSNAV